MANILVCDDDRDIVSALSIYLAAEGHIAIPAYNGAEALEILGEEGGDIKLVLLDIMMPEMDGISTVLKLRETSNVPVILLTAKSEDTDKVLGLNLGADDYVTKPFNPVEVMARVRSQLRRYTLLGGQPEMPDCLGVGNICLYPEGKRVALDGEDVTLTPTEFGILYALLQRPGKVFSAAELYAAVWKEPAYFNESTVAVHIRHLREKLEINPSEPRYIKVVWGHGYKIEPDGKSNAKN